MSRLRQLLLIAPALMVMLGPRESAAAPTTKAEFDRFVDSYFDGFYAFRPVRATQDGVHALDSKVAGFTREEVTAELARLDRALAALGAMTPASLDSTRRIDYEILLNHVQAETLSFRETRRWERDPNYYLDLITSGVGSLAAGSFAPAEARLRSVVAREQATGAILAAAVDNLHATPKAWVEVAAARTRGALGYFRKTLPAAFAEVTDPALRSEFEAANARTIMELDGFQRYLSQDLLPAATDNFRLGPELLLKTLKFEEMCDVPLFRLERYGEEEMKRLQLELATAGAGVDKTHKPPEIVRILSIDHPEPGKLVAAMQPVVDELARFCADKGVVTLPAGARCRVGLAPGFSSPALLTCTQYPGPFEKQALDGWLYLTPPDSAASSMDQDDWMRSFNRYALPTLAMHEAWPGRYLLSLDAARATSRVRRALASRSFVEGWGAYSEQMMFDQKYADGDPHYLFFEVREGLVRCCRYLAALRLHSGSMTYDEAVGLFMKEAYLEKPNAEREARRAMLDLDCVAGLLGKLEMLKLREDYKQYRGAAFHLKEFHDRALSFGRPPIKALRRLLMPGDKGTLL